MSLHYFWLSIAYVLRKRILQNQTYCRKVCMQEGNTQTATERQHALVGPHAARGRTFGCILVARWLSFGSRWLSFGSFLVPFWLPLASFRSLCFPLASFSLPFGTLSLTFARHGAPFSHFGGLLASFPIFSEFSMKVVCKIIFFENVHKKSNCRSTTSHYPEERHTYLDRK